MVAKIKICTLLFFLLILGCTDIKEEKIENIKLDKRLAKQLVSLSVKCVSKISI
jgi:hypothetical protein